MEEKSFVELHNKKSLPISSRTIRRCFTSGLGAALLKVAIGGNRSFTLYNRLTRHKCELYPSVIPLCDQLGRKLPSIFMVYGLPFLELSTQIFKKVTDGIVQRV